MFRRQPNKAKHTYTCTHMSAYECICGQVDADVEVYAVDWCAYLACDLLCGNIVKKLTTYM